jgi:molybdopterin synthase catalytic subunit
VAAPPLTPAQVDVELLAAPFDPLQSLATWQARLRIGSPPIGGAAEAHFIGRVRPVASDGAPLEALEIEHYPGMTEGRIAAISQALALHHGVAAVLVRHRIGRLKPDETIVLVAVVADRRGPALRCCQEVLESLKHEAPFWKREWVNGCGHWVAGNTPL